MLYREGTKKARQLAGGPLVLNVPVGLERVSSIYANNVYGLVIYWSGMVKSEISIAILKEAVDFGNGSDQDAAHSMLKSP